MNGSETPEWLLMAAGILLPLAVIGSMGWGVILEIRYIGPYTLNATASSEKWRRAVILALLQTSMIPLFGLVLPLLSPDSIQWPAFPIICAGIWIVVLPIFVLFKRWDFERHLKRYHRMNQLVRSGMFNRLLTTPLLSWSKLLMTSELKRFFEEGFPEDRSQM
jgi:hypothetical protein